MKTRKLGCLNCEEVFETSKIDVDIYEEDGFLFVILKCPKCGSEIIRFDNNSIWATNVNAVE